MVPPDYFSSQPKFIIFFSNIFLPFLEVFFLVQPFLEVFFTNIIAKVLFLTM